MKQLLRIASFLILASAVLFAQQGPVVPPPISSVIAGQFGQWSIPLASSVTATGSQSFTVAVGGTVTSSGLSFIPFVVNGKITVGVGSNAEVVTISAVSGCAQVSAQGYGQTPTCTITATSFANNHYAQEPVTSADAGIMEAVNYASESGGGDVFFMEDCGTITLNTGGLTTTSTCFVPNLFYNQGSASLVKTTITTSTNWAVGIAGATSTFSTANSTLTAGTTAFVNQGTPAVALATSATAQGLTALLITVTGANAGAGAVHVKVWGHTPAQPAF